MSLKHFVCADIEDPHPCFYTMIEDDPHFSGKWSWAEPDGSPPEGCMFFAEKADAEYACAQLTESHKKRGASFWDSIRVVSLDC